MIFETMIQNLINLDLRNECSSHNKNNILKVCYYIHYGPLCPGEFFTGKGMASARHTTTRNRGRSSLLKTPSQQRSLFISLLTPLFFNLWVLDVRGGAERSWLRETVSVEDCFLTKGECIYWSENKIKSDLLSSWMKSHSFRNVYAISSRVFLRGLIPNQIGSTDLLR